jgi:hypothetical protein
MADRLPPPHPILTRFLRERQPRSVAEVAELLQWPEAQVRRAAGERAALTPDGLVRWDAAAAWMMETWPVAALLSVLGDDAAALLPLGLHPVSLRLELPAYLVLALRTQSRLERMPHRVVPPANFTEYMTDLLHRAIEPETVDALREDAEFVRAWNFPGEGEDDV